MRHLALVSEYAARLDVPIEVAHYLLDQLRVEILRQLSLGESVRLAKLGQFTTITSGVRRRVSNLPGMKGKISAPKTQKRIVFKPFKSALAELSSGQSFLSRLLRTAPVRSSIVEKARKEAIVAKLKKGEHCTIDVPDGVRQVTINLPEAPAKKKKRKKRGAGESGGSKQKLLG